MCVPVTGRRTEGEEGEEGVVSGWIAVHVEAAAARRKAIRRDIGELDRVAARSKGAGQIVDCAQNALYVNARG